MTTRSATRPPARSLLPLYRHHDRLKRDCGERVDRDRLELLTALLGGPGFDPTFGAGVIRVPPDHPVYRWRCVVAGCQRVRTGGTDVCAIHRVQWCAARDRGVGKAEFLATAQPLGPSEWVAEQRCRVCPKRPATHTDLRLCQRHRFRWDAWRRAYGEAADLGGWLGEQHPFDGYGDCQAVVCPSLANSPLGLCSGHQRRYRRQGRPGGAVLASRWWHRFEQYGLPVPVVYDDESRFRAWCATVAPVTWPGQVNLLGLRPLLRAEIQWGLFIHTQRPRPTRWDLGWLQAMVNGCREHGVTSLVDLDLDTFPAFPVAIVREMLHELRLVYFTAADTREAGFLETDHFGVRFPDRASHIDLTAISQRWLRDLLWDYLASLLPSPRCPRTAIAVDNLRRACTELSAFLEADAPGGGHNPARLRAEHAQRFVADQRHRERHRLASLAMRRSDGTPSTVTTNTRCVVFNGVRKLLRDALETGTADQLGLDREFIIAMPAAGGTPLRARSPFPDAVARALAEQANLARLAQTYDPHDRGLRDVWEAIILTGRRTNEILRLRLDCIGRYGGLPVLWHDQTKVGNYDQAIRIPERLYQLLAERQRKTMDRFVARHGVQPTTAQRAAMALFPSSHRNLDGATALSYQWFHSRFKQWVAQLDLGHYVPHQARHTLATNLLRHGATLTHIRRYLGQVSDRMAERYVHLSHSDLEDVLHHVWVAGPGSANPGELLAGPTTGSATPMTREQALALAVDLSRRSTPTEGGFCTFQPVVDGNACPWNLDCHHCDKFVLSGADLLYWRRKREQWASIAERAPDDATADYLHQVFEPTARAIDGLEQALAGLGLLDQALALDLRRPQDYFHRLWSLSFPTAKLAADRATVDESDGNDPDLAVDIDLHDASTDQPQDACA